MKRDIYQEITDKIITAIEADPGKVTMPWHRHGAHSMPENVVSGNQYQGINVITLWVMAETFGYPNSLWGTFKQWQERGAQVRKGSKSYPVVFYKEIEIENDQEGDGKRRIMRWSNVFNVDQVDGYEAPVVDDYGDIDRIHAADQFVATTQAVIEHGGTQACYIPSRDVIQMPSEGRFIDTATSTRTEGYYSVLMHELTHWTGPRCERDLKNRFGDEAYAMEELIAELGSAFLCAELGIEQEPRQDHAQYIANWLQVLKSDKKAIFTAAAKANEAVKYLKTL